MDKTVNRRVLIFSAGVKKIMGRDVELFEGGDGLAADGTIGVRPIHQLGEVGGYGSGHPAFGCLDRRNFFFIEIDEKLKLLRPGDPIL
jgi:hypothetical protein